mgnify:CR=1 FL=1
MYKAYESSGREDRALTGRDYRALGGVNGTIELSMTGSATAGLGWENAVYDLKIYSTADDPWLFDLEKDPDELINSFLDPAHREVVREGSFEREPLLGESRVSPRVPWMRDARDYWMPILYHIIRSRRAVYGCRDRSIARLFEMTERHCT